MVGADVSHPGFPPRRIPQTMLFFHRKLRKRITQRGSKQASAIEGQDALPSTRPYGNTQQATARRTLLQDAAAERELRELTHAACGEFTHCLTVIVAGRFRNQPRSLPRPRIHEPDRLSRNPEAQLHLGTYGDKFDPGPEPVEEKVFSFVAAIPTHGLTKQTARHPDPQRLASRLDS